MAETGLNIFELKTREKIKELNGACMEAEIKDNLPLMSGKMENKNVDVLRDSRSNRLNGNRKLVDEANLLKTWIT